MEERRGIHLMVSLRGNHSIHQEKGKNLIHQVKGSHSCRRFEGSRLIHLKEESCRYLILRLKETNSIRLLKGNC